MKLQDKFKSVDTTLTLSVALVIAYKVTDIEVLLIFGIVMGLVGVFIKPLALLIAVVWLKIGELLGFVFSKIILSVVFYIFLVPISFLYRIAKKDPLRLKAGYNSYFFERNKSYTAEDLKNPW